MINPQWGFNPIIIRMLFAVTLFQQRVALEKVQFGGESPTFLFRDNFPLENEHNGHILSTFDLSLLQRLV
jgi:hypothetical protein